MYILNSVVGDATEAATVEDVDISSVYKPTRSRIDSCNEPSSATPGSITSVTSTESGNYWIIMSCLVVLPLLVTRDGTMIC